MASGDFISLPPGLFPDVPKQSVASSPPEIVVPPAIADDIEATRFVPPQARAIAWNVVLPDGVRVAVGAALIVGREPDDKAHPGAQLLTVDSDDHSVSKSHIVLVADGPALTVRDLGSTNGVAVVHPDGSVVERSAGDPLELGSGDEIELGTLVLTVDAGTL
jgi:hypothetical protein